MIMEDERLDPLPSDWEYSGSARSTEGHRLSSSDLATIYECDQSD